MPDGVFSLDELESVAKKLLDTANGARVWIFYGEMGSGKTTLIKAICKALGVTSTMTSPTFSIVNEYEGNDIIYHFDCYRLKNEDEAYDIGLEEYLDSGKLCLIEWPERISSLIPDERFEVKIEIESTTKRRIHYRLV